ncbi:MAG TPA: FAD-dependent oxidoreductase [Streptosporangiaceae bacterium]
MREDREFVVVGAGLLGLATGHALAARGHDAVVFEQASVGNTAGGSHGSARIFRLGYSDPEYVAMARRAREAWRDLEATVGQQLLVPTGQLSFGEQLADLRNALRQAGAPGEDLTASEAADRFPDVVIDGPCLYEAESCVIAAERALTALAATVPDLRTGQPVTRIEPDGSRVSVGAGEVRVTARAAVVCAGPWARPLLAGMVEVPTTATLEQAAYVARVGGRPGARTSPPIFLRHGGRGHYGLPVPGSGLFKVGLHPVGLGGRPGMAGPVISPGDQDPGEDPGLRTEIIAAVRKHLPGYDPVPVRAERCVYDNSPDEDFIVDRSGPLVVGCGTSGHGFKFGPLLGEWLADLATGRAPSGVPQRFSLARFGAVRMA